MNSDLLLFEKLFAGSSPSAKALPPTLPPLREFYGHWLDWWLEICGLPTHPSARWEELRGLYDLPDRLSPQYCRSDQLEREIRQLGIWEEAEVRQLTKGLQGFFQIVRLSELQPARLVTQEQLERWWQIVPAEKEWELLHWLRRWGLEIPCSQEAWRIWWRFQHGPQPLPEHPREWVRLCQQASRHLEREVSEIEARIREWAGTSRRFQGPCRVVPECDQCSLRSDCAWPSQAVSGDSVDLAWQAQQLNTVKTLSLLRELVPQLRLPSEWEDSAEGSPLRRLEGWSAAEWQTQAEEATRQAQLLLELCRRHGEERLQPGEAFRSSQDLFLHFRHRLRVLKQEVFLVVLLDNKHRYLGEQLITQGLLNRSLVHPREVFAQALEQRAAAIVCLHNHPSGDPQPSPEDHKVTQRLKESGQLLGVPLLDHLVIGAERYVSFADEGWL